jgi:hypothetical protein
LHFDVLRLFAMMPAHRPGSWRRALLPGGCYVLAFLLAAWLARAWGPGQDGQFDSAFYLDGARHLAHGDGYVSAITEPTSSDFGPVVRWAPGFSALIAVGIELGLSDRAATALVLGGGYALSVVLIVALGLQLLGRRNLWAGMLVALTFAAMPGTLESLDALLSDLPFAAFALLAVWLAARVSDARKPTLALRLGFGACLGWLVLMRYAGGLFVPGLLLATAWNMRVRPRSLARAIGQLVPSGLVFIAIVAIWIARNRALQQAGAFGERLFEASSFTAQLRRATSGALAWVWQLTDDARVSGPLGWLCVGALCAGVLACGVIAGTSWLRIRRGLSLLGLPLLGYFAGMVIVSSRVAFDRIDHPRFWIPLWPLTLLAALTIALRARRRWQLPLRGLIVASLLLTAATFTRRMIGELPGADRPRGLLAERWQRAAAILPAPETCRLFVQDPRPFMLHRALGPTSLLPLTAAEFEAAAPRYPALCIAVVSRRMRLSTSAERRRPLQSAIVDQLLAQGRLVRIARGLEVTVYRMLAAPPP